MSDNTTPPAEGTNTTPTLADALRQCDAAIEGLIDRTDGEPAVKWHAACLAANAAQAAARAALDGAPTRELGELRQWAVERWCAEVMRRPLTNVHRRPLDDVWRQVIRYSGGDPDRLIGSSHDDLVNTDAGRAAFRELAKAKEPPAPEITGPMVKRLRDALEGECDGLSIDSKHARAVLEHVFEARSAREPSDEDYSRMWDATACMGNSICARLPAFARAVRAWPSTGDEK